MFDINSEMLDLKLDKALARIGNFYGPVDVEERIKICAAVLEMRHDAKTQRDYELMYVGAKYALDQLVQLLGPDFRVPELILKDWIRLGIMRQGQIEKTHDFLKE